MTNPSSAGGEKPPVIIKKYANRRLYDTESSSYITLEHLSAMTRAGREFKVLDAKTGDDITHNVLTQIIVEEENRGTTLLPVSFLRQIISMYGDQMQAMVPHYLEASMEAFRRNQEQVRSTFGGIAGGGTPLEILARQNMAMMKAAAEMWGKPNFAAQAKTAEAPPPAAEPQAENRQADIAEDVKALKEQLAALQTQIAKLAGD